MPFARPLDTKKFVSASHLTKEMATQLVTNVRLLQQRFSVDIFFTKRLFYFEYIQQDYQTLNQSAGLMRTVREIMLALVLFARTLAN